MAQNIFWPDVSTEESAIKQCKQAAYFAWFIAAMTTLVVALSFAEIEFIQALGIDLWSLIDVVVFAVLGFGVFKCSRVAAVLLLSVYGLERAIALIAAMGSGVRPGGLVFTVFVIAALIGGVRGAFSLARIRAEQQPTGF